MALVLGQWIQRRADADNDGAANDNVVHDYDGHAAGVAALARQVRRDVAASFGALLVHERSGGQRH
jgi:hypothetical protein